jgi:hypothetical protein
MKGRGQGLGVLLELVRLWSRAPRSRFSIHEDNLGVRCIDPPNRGVHVAPLTLTSRRATKTWGVLWH